MYTCARAEPQRYSDFTQNALSRHSLLPDDRLPAQAGAYGILAVPCGAGNQLVAGGQCACHWRRPQHVRAQSPLPLTRRSLSKRNIGDATAGRDAGMGANGEASLRVESEL